MQFKSSPNNPLTELCELRAKVELDPEVDCNSLLVSLKFGKMSVPLKDVEYSVGVSKAYLSLNLFGCETRMGSLFNENPSPTIIENTESVVKSNTRLNLGAGVLSAEPPLEVSATAAAGHTSTKKTTRQADSIQHPVRSLPNNRWEITSPTVSGPPQAIENTPLSNERVCHLDTKDGGNRISLTAEVYARKTDFTVDSTGNKLSRRMRLFRNKEAVVAVIAVRALSREASREGFGVDEKTIVLSRSELEEE